MQFRPLHDRVVVRRIEEDERTPVASGHGLTANMLVKGIRAELAAPPGPAFALAADLGARQFPRAEWAGRESRWYRYRQRLPAR